MLMWLFGPSSDATKADGICSMNSTVNELAIRLYNASSEKCTRRQMDHLRVASFLTFFFDDIKISMCMNENKKRKTT